MNQEQKWVVEARKYVGQKEVPGAASSAWIKSVWLKLRGGSWFWSAYGEDDSKLPWCGAFVAYVMSACGIQYPAKYASAKEWLNWGVPIGFPVPGCIVVFTREGGGHVGFVVGVTADGRLMVLGGNQKDGVCILPFDRNRVAGYRYPPGYYPADAGNPRNAANILPILASNAASSTNEA